ncbi:MAG: thioredoxin [Bacteroidetes bacterium]|nr:thioredoxin [Bacteroidota bacterium]
MSNQYPDFFQKEVIEKSSEKPVVVDFWAPWCGPCRILGPTLEKLAKSSKGTWRLVKVNTDRNQDLSRQFGIRGIPAVMMFRDGEVVDQFVGVQPEPTIRRWLEPHITVTE